MVYIILIIGFIFLIKGADLFVGGASSISKALKVPPILIGLTVVAFGTSAPEAAVSINAALSGSNEIAVGNIIGSNIFNLLMVVGIASIIYPLKIQKMTILKEFPFVFLSSIALIILSFDKILQGSSSDVLTRADGLMLLLIFLVFLYYLIEMAIRSKDKSINESMEIVSNQSFLKSIIKSIIGIAGIIFGADLVVSSSSQIASSFGMSESLVGLTIVSVGTSLPELVTSIVAALKKESDIAMGNVIGSNIFNILFVLGLSSLITPIPVNPIMIFDMLFLIAITLITFGFSITKKLIVRGEGIILSSLYLFYLVFIIIRN
ncbi:MAG: calcium/sodium antiporter [Acidaminobacteraceae bacterium]